MRQGLHREDKVSARRIVDALETALPSRSIGLSLGRPTGSRETLARFALLFVAGLALAAIGLWWPT